jgi:hypothetical protein
MVGAALEESATAMIAAIGDGSDFEAREIIASWRHDYNHVGGHGGRSTSSLPDARTSARPWDGDCESLPPGRGEVLSKKLWGSSPHKCQFEYRLILENKARSLSAANSRKFKIELASLN